MPEVTVAVPSIGQICYVQFKEPMHTALTNKFNLPTLNIKVKVLSIMTMGDMIKYDHKDPFSNIYLPAGISELDYRNDLRNNVYIISFLYVDVYGAEQNIRSPLSYIQAFSDVSNIEYMNRLLVIDLNRLPVDIDLSLYFIDIADFIKTRIGTTPSVKEVSVGNVEFVDRVEHSTRETVRTNMVTVHKTLSTQLNEINLKHTEVMNRLQVLGISLS